MAPKENLKPLKMLVFSMGLLLVGGTVLLGALVWQKVSTEKSAEKSSIHTMADCPGGHVDLKGHGVIVDSTIDGHTMHLILEKTESKSELMMIDICSGKIIGALTIDSDTDIISK